MGMFSELSLHLNNIFSHLTKRGKLTVLEIKEAMREIRIALLEADVNFSVVKDFIDKVSKEAVGEKVLKSLTPGQQVIKIVHEELIKLLGEKNAKLNMSSKSPTIIMLCGLQGSGKTTMCGKLALLLKNKGSRPLLVACDIYRPAAIDQLKAIGSKAKVEVFERGTEKPDKICREALSYAHKNNFDTIIIDTAGRLSIDEELMRELVDIKKEIKPHEILLVVDSMNGQDSVNVAKTFNDMLDITGVILTKLDGDARGGAALSIAKVVKKPIKFCGVGEKIGDIEPFYPDRIASRILGMGDVLTLIEKAQKEVTTEEANKLKKKILENTFTLEDYLTQMKRVKKMGNINDIVSMIPGVNRLLRGATIDERELTKNKAIIQSMTKEERINPSLIKGSQKRRIAKGSGTQIQDVNRLLKGFEQAKLMLKKLKSGNLRGFRF